MAVKITSVLLSLILIHTVAISALLSNRKALDEVRDFDEWSMVTHHCDCWWSKFNNTTRNGNIDCNVAIFRRAKAPL